MIIPPRLLAILEPFLTLMEGNKLRAYRDGAGVWTIGRGHTRNVTPGMVITDAQSDALLAEDMQVFYTAVIAHLGTGVQLTDHELAALTSFAFNAGVTGFVSSELLKDINAEDFTQIHARFMAWDHMHVDGKLVISLGLQKRREAEFTLWSKNDGPETQNTPEPTPCPAGMENLDGFISPALGMGNT